MAVELRCTLIDDRDPRSGVTIFAGFEEKAMFVLIARAVAVVPSTRCSSPRLWVVKEGGRVMGLFLLENFVDRNKAVGGFNRVDIGIVWIGNEFARSACHFEDEFPCGNVPKRDSGFYVSIESATGSVGHGESGTAHHAHFATAEGGFAEAFETDFKGFLVFTTADEDDGFFEFGAGADS